MIDKKHILIILIVLLGLSVVNAIGPEVEFNIPSGFEPISSNDNLGEMMNYDDELYIVIVDGDYRSLAQLIGGMEDQGYYTTGSRDVTIENYDVKEYMLRGSEGECEFIYSFKFRNHEYNILVATSLVSEKIWNIESYNNPVREIITSFRLV